MQKIVFICGPNGFVGLVCFPLPEFHHLAGSFNVVPTLMRQLYA